ncbi:hypothetical protein LX36DRAFT_398906 [Colletotrichum falcatum]|nr:hypothetical protein LX36DRAFT_398906 [Colletotrichum falcatum]
MASLTSIASRRDDNNDDDKMQLMGEIDGSCFCARSVFCSCSFFDLGFVARFRPWITHTLAHRTYLTEAEEAGECDQNELAARHRRPRPVSVYGALGNPGHAPWRECHRAKLDDPTRARCYFLLWPLLSPVKKNESGKWLTEAYATRKLKSLEV